MLKLAIKINFIKDFIMLSFSGSRSSNNTINIENPTPEFYSDDDEISWRLLLLYCDYHASKLPIPTIKNPRISKVIRFFDSMASVKGGDAYLPYRIKNHLCFLTCALNEGTHKHWAFNLATLIQDWLIDPSTQLLREEIREKFSEHFDVWPKVLSACRLDKCAIDNGLCQAYGFMIFQGFLKVVKNNDIALTLSDLCQLLTTANYCTPSSLARSFELSLEDKPKPVPGITMSFDRLSIGVQKKKAKKKENIINIKQSNSLSFFSIKY